MCAGIEFKTQWSQIKMKKKKLKTEELHMHTLHTYVNTEGAKNRNALHCQ